MIYWWQYDQYSMSVGKSTDWILSFRHNNICIALSEIAYSPGDCKGCKEEIIFSGGTTFLMVSIDCYCIGNSQLTGRCKQLSNILPVSVFWLMLNSVTQLSPLKNVRTAEWREGVLLEGRPCLLHPSVRNNYWSSKQLSPRSPGLNLLGRN